jgi:uncharacterized protein (DUF302 family)
MDYTFSKTLAMPFDAALERTVAALKANGFGIITEIDVRETFKAKLGVDFRPYRILGACNPTMAHAALLVEDKIGTMLPCNVIVQSFGPTSTEVAAVDPLASMQAVGNPALETIAHAVRESLEAAIDAL